MKINEIIVKEDRQRVDEIAGRAIAGGLGALAGGLLGGPLGAAAGAAGGAWLGQKLKNVFNPDDPMLVSHRKATNITANEILADYQEFLKSTGGAAGLTPDQVLNWFNQKFRNTTVPGSGNMNIPAAEGGAQPYVFKNPPPSADMSAVKTWLKQEMAQVERDVMTRGPQTPEPELAPEATPIPMPADGTKFRTNKGEYQVKRGGWVDPSGNPVSTEVGNKLTQLYDEQTRIKGLSTYPSRDISLLTTNGEYIYTSATNGRWVQRTDATGASISPTRYVTDPKEIEQLNKIAASTIKP